MLVRRNARIPHRPYKNRIEILAEHFRRVARQRSPVPQKPIRTPIEFSESDFALPRQSRRLEDLNSLGDDLLADAVSGEHAITTDEAEIGYYGHSGLLLEDVVREQVLLSLPSRSLCKADCKGLCPRCGQNLNTASCSCDQAPADPRWNALAGLADKLVK